MSKPPVAQMPLLQLLTPAVLQRMRDRRFRAVVAAAQANPDDLTPEMREVLAREIAIREARAYRRGRRVPRA
ncbi:MAG: hypothetical protein CL878_13945 [Dehalococcoidia bacterium]|nr:hypothetical protein [Dehalococcoidia bacterium]